MTKKSKTPSVPEHDEQGDDRSISSQHLRKRDKFLNIFRSDKSEAHTNSSTPRPEAKIHHTDAPLNTKADHVSAHSSTPASSSGAATPPTTENTKIREDIFSTNVARRASKTVVPQPGACIDNTPQLALCSSLLPKTPAVSPSNELSLEVDLLQIKEASHDTPIDDANREWVTAIEQNAMEQSHVHWLLERMVEEFVKDAVKGSAAVTEIVLLGPVLDYEHYRKLLNCFIAEFEKATMLDFDLLQGLVQLVQCASKGYLVADDLIKILSILRIRLQKTNQQSTKHPYHLTLAVSRVLDVMAKHEVENLDRVEQHEPLGDVLSSLRESTDPFLMYQASYAFQALQYVPNNETVLQAVMRHSGVVAEGLIGISGVLNLNLSGFLEGLGQLQKTVVDTMGIVKSAAEGARSLVDSGKGVFEAIKQGVSSANKRPWYPAVIGANALVREG
ncbi:hypothetical protein BGZ68_007339 [Mortierella alpina]|nr:hypothetical protein BGZ68_007339 [Mortierella alpina]